MKSLIKYLEEWWRKFMLYWIKWIWQIGGHYVGKESDEGTSQMRQWIDEIGIGPLVLNVTIHLSIQWNSWGFAPQSKIDCLSFRNWFLMMKIYDMRAVCWILANSTCATWLISHAWAKCSLPRKRLVVEKGDTGGDTISVTLWIAMFGRCKSKFSHVITVKQQVTPCEFLIHFAQWSNICVFHNLMRICRNVDA